MGWVVWCGVVVICGIRGERGATAMATWVEVTGRPLGGVTFLGSASRRCGVLLWSDWTRNGTRDVGCVTGHAYCVRGIRFRRWRLAE